LHGNINYTGIGGFQIYLNLKNLNTYGFMKTYYLVPQGGAEKFAVLPLNFLAQLAKPS
jgi:hypothetical protein